jgi:hypothetical protein
VGFSRPEGEERGAFLFAPTFLAPVYIPKYGGRVMVFVGQAQWSKTKCSQRHVPGSIPTKKILFCLSVGDE